MEKLLRSLNKQNISTYKTEHELFMELETIIGRASIDNQ